ncbi:hypothetical protein FISHEDRAFT_60172 [Fistulina hepatica ATCC 64428]|uniref:Uncharacterized protein n=1 Tax=Fistulina hepatica ATCC 64428 TaxID=1128425 RepID=A0A0D7A8H3_9AGAR|nr:hypothetical protein FISHEDRAFT_60172 [Fistulina hepatica ATCC 64428]
MITTKIARASGTGQCYSISRRNFDSSKHKTYIAAAYALEQSTMTVKIRAVGKRWARQKRAKGAAWDLTLNLRSFSRPSPGRHVSPGGMLSTAVRCPGNGSRIIIADSDEIWFMSTATTQTILCNGIYGDTPLSPVTRLQWAKWKAVNNASSNALIWSSKVEHVCAGYQPTSSEELQARRLTVSSDGAGLERIHIHTPQIPKSKTNHLQLRTFRRATHRVAELPFAEDSSSIAGTTSVAKDSATSLLIPPSSVTTSFTDSDFLAYMQSSIRSCS